jgi:hypothetical protein
MGSEVHSFFSIAAKTLPPVVGSITTKPHQTCCGRVQQHISGQTRLLPQKCAVKIYLKKYSAAKWIGMHAVSIKQVL